MSASVGHAHVHQRAKLACVRSRGWIPHHEHRCRSLTADPGAVLVNRKHARLRRPIVREALEALEPREKPVAAEGLHGEYLERRGRFLRRQHRRRTLELNQSMHRCVHRLRARCIDASSKSRAAAVYDQDQTLRSLVDLAAGLRIAISPRSQIGIRSSQL